MELEFFVEPGTDEQWHEEWLEARLNWWAEQGVPRESIEILDVPADELSHYSKRTYDIMYRFPHGLEELEGIANRTDFDLGSPARAGRSRHPGAGGPNDDSNTRLAVQDPESRSGSCPTSSSPRRVDRGVLAVLNEAYRVEELENGNSRTVLALRAIADQGGGSGEEEPRGNRLDRARAQAARSSASAASSTSTRATSARPIVATEVGTPICITVDFDTIEGDGSVTVRDRDGMAQDAWLRTGSRNTYGSSRASEPGGEGHRRGALTRGAPAQPLLGQPSLGQPSLVSASWLPGRRPSVLPRPARLLQPAGSPLETGFASSQSLRR